MNLLTVKDIMALFHVSRNTAYELMGSEGFPSLKVNNRIYVESSKLEEWIENNIGEEFHTA